MCNTAISIYTPITQVSDQGDCKRNQYEMGAERYEVDTDIHRSIDGRECKKLEFSIRKMGDVYYLYSYEKYNRGIEWAKSLGMFFLNIIHTLAQRVFIPLGTLFLNLVKCNISKEKIDKAKSLVSRLIPLRALLVMIPQMVLNLASFISCGLFSHTFNRWSGDLERFVFQVSKDDLANKSLNQRHHENDYAAPCQQPKFVSLPGWRYDSSNEDVKLQEITPRNQLRAVLPMLWRGVHFASNIPKTRCCFPS